MVEWRQLAQLAVWVQAVEWAMAGWERGRSRDDRARAEHGYAMEEMVGEGVYMVEGQRPACVAGCRSEQLGRIW